MFMFRKNQQIQEKVGEYFQRVRESLVTFQAALNYWFENGLDAHFRTFYEDAHAQESKADDLRMDVDVMLYQKTLLPESRREILMLLERTDHIPNLAESILNQIETERIAMPDFMQDEVRELVRVSLEAFDLVLETVRLCLGESWGPGKGVMDLVEQVDHKESVCDKIEQNLVRKLFRSSLDKADMILIKEVVIQMGDVSDHCESIADFLKIFHIKHQV